MYRSVQPVWWRVIRDLGAWDKPALAEALTIMQRGLSRDARLDIDYQFGFLLRHLPTFAVDWSVHTEGDVTECVGRTTNVPAGWYVWAIQGLGGDRVRAEDASTGASLEYRTRRGSWIPLVVEEVTANSGLGPGPSPGRNPTRMAVMWGDRDSTYPAVITPRAPRLALRHRARDVGSRRSQSYGPCALLDHLQLVAAPFPMWTTHRTRRGRGAYSIFAEPTKRPPTPWSSYRNQRSVWKGRVKRELERLRMNRASLARLTTLAGQLNDTHLAQAVDDRWMRLETRTKTNFGDAHARMWRALFRGTRSRPGPEAWGKMPRRRPRHTYARPYGVAAEVKTATPRELRAQLDDGAMLWIVGLSAYSVEAAQGVEDVVPGPDDAWEVRAYIPPFHGRRHYQHRRLDHPVAAFVTQMPPGPVKRRLVGWHGPDGRRAFAAVDADDLIDVLCTPPNQRIAVHYVTRPPKWAVEV